VQRSSQDQTPAPAGIERNPAGRGDQVMDME
jgi:hypothetical protein